MEASCSGRCACSAPCLTARSRRTYCSKLVWQLPLKHRQQRALLHLGSQHTISMSRAKRKHRQCIAAAQSSGEVAEVQELHGVRLVADAQKRPQVQYLVMWKDGTPDTWQVPLLFIQKVYLLVFQSFWNTMRALSSVHAGSLHRTWLTTCCVTLKSVGGVYVARYALKAPSAEQRMFSHPLICNSCFHRSYSARLYSGFRTSWLSANAEHGCTLRLS